MDRRWMEKGTKRKVKLFCLLSVCSSLDFPLCFVTLTRSRSPHFSDELLFSPKKHFDIFFSPPRSLAMENSFSLVFAFSERSKAQNEEEKNQQKSSQNLYQFVHNSKAEERGAVHRKPLRVKHDSTHDREYKFSFRHKKDLYSLSSVWCRLWSVLQNFLPKLKGIFIFFNVLLNRNCATKMKTLWIIVEISSVCEGIQESQVEKFKHSFAK